MSQENVETFERSVDACNRRDVEAILETIWPALARLRSRKPQLLGGR